MQMHLQFILKYSIIGRSWAILSFNYELSFV